MARHEVAPIITFDQPQKWKAFTIMYNKPPDSKLHNIIIRLGGFHTWMSFMVPIHLIMEDSAIGYLWWKIYADSTLNHMVSGKAYVRATRGHLQVTIASSTIMTSMVFITAIAPFLWGVELSDIHDTETTAPYREAPQMLVSIATTDKSEWICRI